MRNPIFIQAQFRGQDGSLGLKHAKDYTIRIAHKPGQQIFVTVAGQQIPYDSLLGFIDNWHIKSLPLTSIKNNTHEQSDSITTH